MKSFLVMITDCTTLPYEESLLDGTVNKNHLMYLACADLQKRGKTEPGLDPTRVSYKFFEREFNDDGSVKSHIQL